MNHHEVVFVDDEDEDSNKLLKLEKSDELFVDDWSWIRWWTLWLCFRILNVSFLLNINVLSCY